MEPLMTLGLGLVLLTVVCLLACALNLSEMKYDSDESGGGIESKECNEMKSPSKWWKLIPIGLVVVGLSLIAFACSVRWTT